ncbi:hypothetical protein M2137_002602 [Parabacteroides sp. PFB2-10]|uniref:hypothetical protein n=1 Tax=Parabacteroides sp. PFB2-10 TaxID=1742405 RepID=UPI002473C767|nr:hypothetical protein [Parabacteroides sp. PFB2-10]MDH6313811.1 hypothetical protein [Parabacteroides sp. PFB2-10]
MSIFSKIFGRKKTETGLVDSERTMEEFMTFVRVYYQGVIAVNLGVTNMNMLPDLALFKRMLKIPTQNNKPGLAEKSKVKKVLMADYDLKDSFFREIDASVKKNCKKQQDIQSYFFKFQGFCNDLFSLLDNLMKWKFRLSMLNKKLLYQQTEKTVHDIVTKSEWKEVNDQKAAWSVRKTAEVLGYSEEWMTDFIYNIVLLAKNEAKMNAKKK